MSAPAGIAPPAAPTSTSAGPPSAAWPSPARPLSSATAARSLSSSEGNHHHKHRHISQITTTFMQQKNSPFPWRNAMILKLAKRFNRTPCKYPGKNIAFHVNEGSTNFWLSLLVEFEDADGDIGSMHIKQVNFPFSKILLLHHFLCFTFASSCPFFIWLQSCFFSSMKKFSDLP